MAEFTPSWRTPSMAPFSLHEEDMPLKMECAHDEVML
jgi:hypothetical protein